MKPTPQSPLISALALAAALAMAASYEAPLWWVSLTAPNYPQDRFPDGIRIQFGFTGVSNGCKSAAATSRVAQETTQEDLGWKSDEKPAQKAILKTAETQGALDCVDEMNTINHYVGMRPIEVGAPVELILGKFILGIFAVMLLGFAAGGTRLAVPALGLGFAGVTGWMVVELFVKGSLAAYVAHYQDAAGKYFREAERIAAWGTQLTQVTTGIVVGLTALMALMIFGTWKWRGFQLLLGIVPALLPLFFVGAFAGWLWFFGHNMHPWGAFTLKPFMPTVFGDGKVAQFTTHSYPHWGFGLLVATFAFLLVAVARRRLELATAHAEVERAP